MVELENESSVFPVVLYDGESQVNVGNITINPTLDFKQFQKMLKETVGISYNNLTTYLVDNNTSPERRKILITSKVNFAVIVLEKNCYFLVVLKRSRRDRRRKINKINKPILFEPLVPVDYYSMSLGRIYSDLIDEHVLSGYSLHGYDDQFHDFEMMKQNYINWRHELYSPVNASFPTVERSRELCKDCTRAEKEGSKAAFHFCVYDDVVSGGFRSPVGPICRPP